MKILFFIADRDFGVTSLLVGQAIPFNNIKEIDFTFISGTLEKEPGLFEKLHQNQIIPIKIEGIEFHKNFRMLINNLNKIIRIQKPEFIHVQTNWQLILIAFVKIFYRSKFKIIYTIHGFRHNEKFKSIFARFFIGMALYFFANKIIACSTYAKNKFKLISYKISILYLGVDNIFFDKSNNDDLKLDGNLQIIFPGEFRRGKNQELIIRSFADYLKNNNTNNIVLNLPGNGSNRESCIKLAEDLGIKDNVLFPGFISKEKVVSSIKESSIAIIPTNSETFGLCITEPFSYGRCVISRNVGVAPDIIKPDENGFLFIHDSELSPLLTFILNNKDVILRCGNNAFEQRNLFNWDAIASEYYNLIKYK